MLRNWYSTLFIMKLLGIHPVLFSRVKLFGQNTRQPAALSGMIEESCVSSTHLLWWSSGTGCSHKFRMPTKLKQYILEFEKLLSYFFLKSQEPTPAVVSSTRWWWRFEDCSRRTSKKNFLIMSILQLCCRLICSASIISAGIDLKKWRMASERGLPDWQTTQLGKLLV